MSPYHSKKQYQNISQKYNFFSSIVERKDLVDQHCIRATKDTDDGELKLINCGCSDQLKVFLLWNASSKLIAKISGIFDSFQHPILERGGVGEYPIFEKPLGFKGDWEREFTQPEKVGYYRYMV